MGAYWGKSEWRKRVGLLSAVVAFGVICWFVASDTIFLSDLENSTRIWIIVGLGLLTAASVPFFAKGHPTQINHRLETTRRFTFELLVVLISIGLLIDGVSAHIANLGNRNEYDRITTGIAELSRWAQTMVAIEQDRPLMTADVAKVLEESGFEKTSNAMRDTLIAINMGDPNWKQMRKEALESLRTDFQKSEYQLKANVRKGRDLTARIQRSVVGVLLASIILFAFMRKTRAKDQELIRAFQDTDQARTDYGNLVENVPVSLFSYRNGEIAFYNSAWSKLMGIRKDEDATAALYNTIHPDDVPAIYANLNASNPAPFRTHYRTQESWGAQRHFVMQGAPVNDLKGNFSHVLAFIIDISENMQARLALQRKNEEIQNTNDRLAKAKETLENNIEAVVKSLVKAIDAKDPYTAGHSERVMHYSLLIGEELGLGPYELRVLQLGTLVHDVGKIGMPDRVLLKPDKLTPEEFEIVKTHPVQGVRILESIVIFEECLPIVRWHHEKLDGTGYPDKLKGDEIPYLVRICCVADMFDAMTSTRSYRAGMDVKTVFGILYEDAHKGKIDLVVVQALERAINRHGLMDDQDQISA